MKCVQNEHLFVNLTIRLITIFNIEIEWMKRNFCCFPVVFYKSSSLFIFPVESLNNKSKLNWKKCKLRSVAACSFQSDNKDSQQRPLDGWHDEKTAYVIEMWRHKSKHVFKCLLSSSNQLTGFSESFIFDTSLQLVNDLLFQIDRVRSFTSTGIRINIFSI